MHVSILSVGSFLGRMLSGTFNLFFGKKYSFFNTSPFRLYSLLRFLAVTAVADFCS